MKRGKKGVFWTTIGQLMVQEEDLPLKDPQNTVKTMVAARKVERKRHEQESGKVQPETNLSQAVNLWIQHEVLERLKGQAKKPSTQKDKEAKEAASYRSNFLFSISKKSQISEDLNSSHGMEDDTTKPNKMDGEAESEEEILATAKIWCLRRKSKDSREKTRCSRNRNSNDTAFHIMGIDIAAVMKVMGQGGDIETGQRLDGVEIELHG
jgi:hypothetical protein